MRCQRVVAVALVLASCSSGREYAAERELIEKAHEAVRSAVRPIQAKSFDDKAAYVHAAHGTVCSGRVTLKDPTSNREEVKEYNYSSDVGAVIGSVRTLRWFDVTDQCAKSAQGSRAVSKLDVVL